MTKNTKSLIKHTILGLLAGGSASALYTMNKLKNEKKDDPEFRKDEISVPLSRNNFLKAVRPERLSGGKPKNSTVPDSGKTPEVDVASMTPGDIAALKKSLLRKSAEGRCSSVKGVESTSSSEFPVRNITGAGSTFRRDKKGRFTSDSSLGKKAGVFDDASATLADNVGMIGGAAAGVVLTKLIADKILINKRKRQVEESRRRYVDALSREVNDEDLPYYSKTAADRGMIGLVKLIMNKIAENRASVNAGDGSMADIEKDLAKTDLVESMKSASDRSLTGSALGLAQLAGLGMAGAAGLVMYRIMENRRKEEEKAKDKDLQRYPTEKTIRFSFPGGSPSR